MVNNTATVKFRTLVKVSEEGVLFIFIFNPLEDTVLQEGWWPEDNCPTGLARVNSGNNWQVLLSEGAFEVSYKALMGYLRKGDQRATVLWCILQLEADIPEKLAYMAAVLPRVSSYYDRDVIAVEQEWMI